MNFTGITQIIRKNAVKKPLFGFCPVCGKYSLFFHVNDRDRENFKCLFCFSISRNRHLAKALCQKLGILPPFSLRKMRLEKPGLRIYETQSSGPLHRRLKPMKNYAGSEYLDDVPPGEKSDKGILCQDVQNLTFDDEIFDIVISQDVLEHVRIPEAAWREINRILKPGGFHIFTVPFNPSGKTFRRIEINGDKDIYTLPKEYHQDSIRDGLVYTNFGTDIAELIDEFGYKTEISPAGLNDQKKYCIYDSYVFISEKTHSAEKEKQSDEGSE